MSMVSRQTSSDVPSYTLDREARDVTYTIRRRTSAATSPVSAVPSPSRFSLYSGPSSALSRPTRRTSVLTRVSSEFSRVSSDSASEHSHSHATHPDALAEINRVRMHQSNVFFAMESPVARDSVTSKPGAGQYHSQVRSKEVTAKPGSEVFHLHRRGPKPVTEKPGAGEFRLDRSARPVTGKPGQGDYVLVDRSKREAVTGKPGAGEYHSSAKKSGVVAKPGHAEEVKRFLKPKAELTGKISGETRGAPATTQVPEQFNVSAEDLRRANQSRAHAHQAIWG